MTPRRMVRPSAAPVAAPVLETTRMIATAMSADVMAATGAPTPSATAATKASVRVPVAVGASPAPRSARPGHDREATRISARRSTFWSAGIGVVMVASNTSGQSSRPAQNAPRRLERMAMIRRPLGSGRQFGDQGFAGPMTALYLYLPPIRHPLV